MPRFSECQTVEQSYILIFRHIILKESIMPEKKTDLAIAVYNDHAEAEAAIKELQRGGFDMKAISIIGKNFHSEEHILGFFNAGDRAKMFGKSGAFWGGLMGILFSSAMMFIPVVGHVIVLGPLAASIFGAIEGAAVVGGISALVGALTAIGIPKNSVLRYETALKADKFLLIMHGDQPCIERAEKFLRETGFSPFDEHIKECTAPSPGQS